MRVFTDRDLLPEFRNPVVTVGSFDGVHTGHAHLLDIMKAQAAEAGSETTVVTFAQHPRHVLQAKDEVGLLTSLKEKALLLDGQGVDNLYVMSFDEAVSRLSGEQFLRDVLIGRLGARQLVVGYNHHFGHNKEGDAAMLRELEAKYGFSIHEAPQFRSAGDKVSSTVIRGAILAGDMPTAARLLGHPYIIMARIAPTGELVVEEPLKLLPPAGRYPVVTGDLDAVLTVDAAGRLTLETSISTHANEELLITFL
jgi:riboflavin kinase/FMN adenylyltransferase